MFNAMRSATDTLNSITINSVSTPTESVLSLNIADLSNGPLTSSLPSSSTMSPLLNSPILDATVTYANYPDSSSFVSVATSPLWDVMNSPILSAVAQTNPVFLILL